MFKIRSLPPWGWAPWSWALLLITLAVWGLTDVRERGRVDPNDPLVHKTDLTVYTEAGAAFFDGRNPYDVANPRGWRYLYPPLLAIAMAPLSKLDPQWQVVVWFFLNVAFSFGCFVECRRIVRLLRPVGEEDSGDRANVAIPPVFGWLIVAAMALPTLNCLQRGQVGILLALVLLLGLRLTLENRAWWSTALGGAALALAIAIKLTPALPVGVLLVTLMAIAWRHGWPAEATQRLVRTTAGVGVGLGLFLVLIPGLAVGQAANIAHLRVWFDRIVVHHDMGEENNSGFLSVRNQSLANAVYRLGNWTAYHFAGGPDDGPAEGVPKQTVPTPMDAPVVGRLLTVARAALLLLLLVAGWKASRRGAMLDVAAIFGLASLLSLVVSPLSWGHHFVIALPALVAAPLWFWQAGRNRWAMSLLIGFAAIVVSHYLLLEYAGRWGVLGIGSTVWFIAAATGMIVARPTASSSASTGPETIDLASPPQSGDSRIRFRQAG